MASAISADASLLKKKAAKEGFLEKAKQAKNGKDEMRGGWAKRYFVLQGYYLRYFKKEDQKDRKEKAAGTIDLRNAKIDPVDPDKAENRRSCFKVQTSGFNYTYCQCPNEEDREWWIYHLRKAAKYDDPQSSYYMKDLLSPDEIKQKAKKEAAEAKKLESASGSGDSDDSGGTPTKGPKGKGVTSPLSSSVSPSGGKKKDHKLSSEEPPGVFAAEINSGDESWVAGWGNGLGSQFGNDENKVSLSPVICSALTKLKIQCIAAGRTHCAAITDKGRLYMWGSGDKLQLGLGSRMKESKTPTMLTRIVRETLVMVACGDSHTLALTSMGEVYSWGDGSKGQLGHGDFKSQEYPALVERISKSEKKCRYIAACGDNSAGIVNEYFCAWGSNTHGQLGIPELQPRPKPGAITELPLKDDRIKQIALGYEFGAAVMESGALFAVGNNSHGQCGHTAPPPHHLIKPVGLATQGGSKCLSVTCGTTHMVAIVLGNDRKTSALVFGETDAKKHGKLGQAIVIPNAIYAHSSPSHYLLVIYEDSRRRIWGAGDNTYGQLGTGSVKPVPTQQASIIATDLVAVQLAAGHEFSLALFKNMPPEKPADLVDGKVEEYVSQEQLAAKEAEGEKKRLEGKAEEERKRKAAEEAERKKKEEDEKRRQEKAKILREHYGGIKPCTVKGCIAGRAGGIVHCERHKEDPSAAPDPDVLPPLWEAGTKNGRTYYTNTSTKKTQWKRPEFDVSILHSGD